MDIAITDQPCPERHDLHVAARANRTDCILAERAFNLDQAQHQRYIETGAPALVPGRLQEFPSGVEVRLAAAQPEDHGAHPPQVFHRTGLHIERLDILEVGNDKYLLPNGAMSVYKWRNNTWNNICKGANRGFNYGNKAFVHKGKIYCWGGYGFWRGHGMLIVFQEDLGEWELLPFTGDLQFMFGWHTNIGLYAFTNKKSIDINIDDQNIKEKQDDFKLDYPIMEPLHWNALDFKNYYYLYQEKAILIDKNTGERYTSKQVPFRGYYQKAIGMFRIFGDSATYFKGDMDHRYDLCVKDEIQFFERVEKKNSGSYQLILMLSLIPLAFGVYFLYRKGARKKSKLTIPNNEPFAWNNKYIDA